MVVAFFFGFPPILEFGSFAHRHIAVVYSVVYLIDAVTEDW
jgi:hypothetical protein